MFIFNTLREACLQEDSRRALLQKHAPNTVAETPSLPAVVEQSVPQPHTPIAINPHAPLGDRTVMDEMVRVHKGFKGVREMEKHYPKGKFVGLDTDSIGLARLGEDSASLVEDPTGNYFEVEINGFRYLAIKPKLIVDQYKLDATKKFFTLPNSFIGGKVRLVKPAILSEQGELLQLGELAPL